jgi:hypothetical protein
MPPTLTLVVMPQRLAICRFAPGEEAGQATPRGGFFSLTCTAEETSLVCEERYAPAAARVSRGWRGLRVQGPLPLDTVGVLAGLARGLAQAGVSLFALSTYDTDYLLVRATQLEQACAALASCGYALGATAPGDGKRYGDLSST